MTVAASPRQDFADGDPPESLLRVRGLHVEFGSRDNVIPAVRGVDLDVRPGETLAVLGESGSGKSVTMRAIMGLAGPNASVRVDEMRLDDADLVAASSERLRSLRGDRITMVFQDALSALNPVISIGSQLAEVFRIHRDMSRRQIRAEVLDLLSAVGISDPAARARHYPHEFSGGMRQRIVIAMAIALRPRLLIADEPTTALDVTVQAQILDLLTRLQREMDLAMVLITHDLGVACEVADRVAIMYHGRIVETGTTTEVLARPAHPYTAALMLSVPQGGDVDELTVIAGSPPQPTTELPGCAFAPRCSYAIDMCTAKRPLLTEVDVSGRAAACHRWKDVLRG